MGFFSRLRSKLFGMASEPDIILFDVRCDRCGEEVRVRVNKKTDLQSEYKQPGEPGPAYTLKKEVMDNKCFQLMQMSVEFDHNYQVISKEIVGGKFISQETKE